MINLKSKLGFTAVEVVLGLVIAALIWLALTSTLTIFRKEESNVRGGAENAIETAIVERVILADLNNIEVSFNNLKIEDDFKQEFFQFHSDVPRNVVVGSLNREITLNATSKRDFYFLIQDLTAGAMMIYDPAAAYIVGAAPDDFNEAANLSFAGINQDNWVGKIRPEFWRDGRLLMLDTSARVRTLSGDGGVDMAQVARSPIFIGAVQGETLEPESELSSSINSTHPESGQILNSADQFLRTVPSMGGGQPLVRLRAVKMVKYFLQESAQAAGQKSAPMNLMRSVFENGKWGSAVLLATNVESFKIYRESILKKVIYFKIQNIEKL